MNDVLGYLGMMILGMLVGLFLSIAGVRDNVTDDCKNFGAFMNGEERYECRLVEPRP